MSQIMLFCFPYAGGSVTAFLSWKSLLAAGITLPLLEIAGRSRRLSDPFYESMEQTVDDLYRRICPEIGDQRFMFFGHSMGALIAFELARKLKAAGHKTPEHIFFSGARAPHLHGEEKVIYHLPDDEFKQEIVELGGTSSEIFKHRELEKVYLPILRADFKITNTYKYVPDGRLDCGITVFYGDREFIPDTDINAWKDYSARQCLIISFPGDHFFINEYKEKIVAIINETPKMGNPM